MSIRKLIAAAGALAMVVVLTPTSADAARLPRSNRFIGVTNPTQINVTCAPGASTGTSPTPVKIKATKKLNPNPNDSSIGNSLGRSTKLVASYPGGSTTMGSFEKWYTFNANKKFKFPCPRAASAVAERASSAVTSEFVITIQPFRGNKKIGTPAVLVLILVRVGSAS